jgi:putative oxidoreductase
MFRDLGLLAMRVIVGLIFAAHGYPKLFGGPNKEVPQPVAEVLGQGFVEAVHHGSPENFVATVERVGAPEPTLTAWFVAGLEFIGGLMLVLGLWTRPVALLLAVEMVEAIRRVHLQHGLMAQGGFEFPLSLLGACLGLVGAGPGAFSIDGGEPVQTREVIELKGS